MYFTFIDESGYPKPGEKDARPVLCATCIKDQDIRQITQRLYKAELDCFGVDQSGGRQLKGKKMIDARSLADKYNNRRNYVEKVFEILEMFDTAIFAVVMEKPDFMPYIEPGNLPIQHRNLLRLLEMFGESKNSDVLVIFDKVDDAKDGAIAGGFKGFLFKHEEGKGFNRVVEMPLFVASINTPLIRYPDLIGNVLREYYNRRLDKQAPCSEFDEWLSELFCRVQARSYNFGSGKNKLFGIYQMAKE